MNQTCQTGINVSGIPLWTTGSIATPARASESPRKHLSIRHSITACAVLLVYLAIYMCVGFAAVALVARAWLAIFE